jgi:hypothetical protein
LYLGIGKDPQAGGDMDVDHLIGFKAPHTALGYLVGNPDNGEQVVANPDFEPSSRAAPCFFSSAAT